MDLTKSVRRESARRKASRLGGLLAALLFPFGETAIAMDLTREGELIYQRRCASCHGKFGEGSKDYPRPLAGDRSIAQLTKLISETMPEDNPGSCTGKEAETVSAYLFDAFYSKAARDRMKPPRIELARLTVPQYRNAVADLFLEFGQPANWNQERGLRGEYFKGNGFEEESRVIARLDPEVNFDFGASTPAPDKIEPNELSARWSGSILAERSGEYEFIVRSEHGVALFVNSLRQPLIDATVKSGTDTEFRGSIRLVAGRLYRVRLHFSKVGLGVVDKKKSKPVPTKATIALLWKPSGGTVEVIPNRSLSPNEPSETLLIQAPFPPDDRSTGYERGTSISKAWEQATTEGAIESADYVVDNLSALGCDVAESKNRRDLLRGFCLKFAERAFRKPLTDSQRELYIDLPFKDVDDPRLAMKRSIMAIMKSPRFLYREVGSESLDPYDVASRLSFAAWDSIPDAQLRDAAASGRLASRKQVESHAKRMLADPRAHAKIREFFLHWLRLDHAPEITKELRVFPGFDQSLIADLRQSLDLFIDEVVWGDSPDFRRLLTADYLFLNDRLAKYYGALPPVGSGFEKVRIQPEERAGLVSHPYVMATFSYQATTSPIHRGVFLARGVLGRLLKPPPVAVSPLSDDLHASLTTRERVAIQTRPAACHTCHSIINPLGFALERFDADGRFRSEEKRKPVDASGSYQTLGGDTARFNGARELAEFLCGSEEVHKAFIEQLFHSLIKQPIRAYSPAMHQDLLSAWIETKFDIRELVTKILTWSSIHDPLQPLPHEAQSGKVSSED